MGEFSWATHFMYEVTRPYPETVEMWCLLTYFLTSISDLTFVVISDISIIYNIFFYTFTISYILLWIRGEPVALVHCHIMSSSMLNRENCVYLKRERC
jgi:hypothetical protein